MFKAIFGETVDILDNDFFSQNRTNVLNLLLISFMYHLKWQFKKQGAAMCYKPKIPIKSPLQPVQDSCYNYKTSLLIRICI